MVSSELCMFQDHMASRIGGSVRHDSPIQFIEEVARRRDQWISKKIMSAGDKASTGIMYAPGSHG